jgi:AraC family transcriptional regulator
MIVAQRSWQGLAATLIDTHAGAVRAVARDAHWLVVHMGRPVRASCRLDGRSQTRLQCRGDVDVVPAGAEGVWQDDRASRVLLLELQPSLVRATAAQLQLDPKHAQLAPKLQLRDPRIAHLAHAVEAELAAPTPGSALYSESLAIALATRLLAHAGTAPAQSASTQPGLPRRKLLKVTEYIEANLASALTLTELASVAGLSTSHFKVLFKRSLQLSVHQYVLRHRIERARLLLETDTLTLAEIAARTGFSDQSHMARWLRRTLGTRPTALRAERSLP